MFLIILKNIINLLLYKNINKVWSFIFDKVVYKNCFFIIHIFNKLRKIITIKQFENN